jgi:hypothetical protein
MVVPIGAPNNQTDSFFLWFKYIVKKHDRRLCRLATLSDHVELKADPASCASPIVSKYGCLSIPSTILLPTLAALSNLR